MSGWREGIVGTGVVVAAAVIVGALALFGGGGGNPSADTTTPSAASSTAPSSTAPASSSPATIGTSSTSPATTSAPFREFAVASSIPTLPGPIDLELVGNDLWVMTQQQGTLQRFDINSPNPTALDTVPLGFSEGRNGNDSFAGGEDVRSTAVSGAAAIVDNSRYSYMLIATLNRDQTTPARTQRLHSLRVDYDFPVALPTVRG